MTSFPDEWSSALAREAVTENRSSGTLSLKEHWRMFSATPVRTLSSSRRWLWRS